jgi:hypothetical protein
MDLREQLTQDLVREITRRGAQPRCRCGRWPTYVGVRDRHGVALRCRGCLKIVAECLCI